MEKEKQVRKKLLLLVASVLMTACFAFVAAGATYAQGAPPASRVGIFCFLGFMCAASSPSASPTASPTSTATASPTASGSPTAAPSTTPGWFQANGRVMSLFNKSGQNTNYGINETVPSGKYLDSALNAIVAAFSDITTTQGSATMDLSKLGPSPGPNIPDYTSFNTRSDTGSGRYNFNFFWSRLEAVDPSPSPLDSWNNVQPASGIYATLNPFTITGAWHLTNNTHIIAFVNNTLTIQNNISVDPGSYLAFFVASGGINIDQTVSEVDGQYFTDGKLCTMCNASGTVESPSPSSSPSPVEVQVNHAGVGSGANQTLSYAGTTTVGNRAIAIATDTQASCSGGVPSISSVSDNSGQNTWHKDLEWTTNGTGGAACAIVSIWSAPIGTSFTTVNFNGLANFIATNGSFIILEYSGLSSAQPDVDAHATSTGVSTSPTVGPTSTGTTAAGELALTVYLQNSQQNWSTQPSGTQRENDMDGANWGTWVGEQKTGIVGSYPSNSGTVASSTPWLMGIVTYK